MASADVARSDPAVRLLAYLTVNTGSSAAVAACLCWLRGPGEARRRAGGLRMFG
jgi:hypothetical protein